MGKVEEKLMKEEKSEDTGKWLHLSIFVTESDDNRNSANDKIAASDSWLLLYSRLYVLLDHICIATSPHPPPPPVLLPAASTSLSSCLRFDNTSTNKCLACFVIIKFMFNNSRRC